MKALEGVVLGFSAASLCIGAVYMLRPSGRMARSVKFAFSVVFLVLLVASLSSFLKIKLPSLETDNDASLSASAAALSEYNAELVCRAVLRDKGYTVNKISIDTDITEPSGISIKRITVFGSGDLSGCREVLLSVIEAGEVEVINE